MGGIVVDEAGRTSVEGLWACGEVAASGLHGANRLASNSLLEAVVYAHLVAESIGGAAHVPRSQPRPVAVPPGPAAAALRALLSEALGVVRDRAGLSAAIERLQPLAFTGGATADPALVALMIATGALAREESRGSHWRRDFTDTSPLWACHLVQRVHETGTRLTCRPLPLPAVSPSLAAGD
jgi:L-aspartate oxidase